MATTNITLSDDSLLAEYVPLEKFKTLLEQRIAISPDLLAVLIRDGQIAEAAPGGHFSIGGVWRTIKDTIGGEHALRLLIADLKPFQITTGATALTKDNVPVAAEFTIELQVNPEKPANVLGLMRDHGAVTKAGALNRLIPHLGERVLAATVRRVDALELRGNVGMQDKIQADSMLEVERIAADVGLIARVVSVGWGLNEEEKAQILKREQEREQEGLEREFKILNRSVEREAESTIVKLKTDLDIEKVKSLTEDELRRLVLSNELGFIDARETGIRIQQMKALEHELQLNRTQRLDGLKVELEAEQHAIELARLGGEKRGVARGVELDDRRHDVDVTKIGGDKRDVEMDIQTRERTHDLAVTRIRADMRGVERTIEDADRRQVLSLTRLEEMQKLEIAAKAHEDQIKTLRGMTGVDLEAEGVRLDLKLKGEEAAHQRALELAKLAEQSKLENLRLMRDATPEQILAMNAGFSPQVANVIIEQAKAKAAEGADRQAVLREMIAQAQEAKVSSEAQARHFFDTGVTGNVGVAHGVGTAVGVGAATGAMAAGGAGGMLGGDTTECPACHRVIPTTDRFCMGCGRPMRQ